MNHLFDTPKTDAELLQNTDSELYQRKHYKGPKNTVEQMRNGTLRLDGKEEHLIHFLKNAFNTKKPSTLTLDMQIEIRSSEHLISEELKMFDLEYQIAPEARTPHKNKAFYAELLELEYLKTKTTAQLEKSVKDPKSLEKMLKLKAKFEFKRPDNLNPIPNSVLKHTWPLPVMAYSYLREGTPTVGNGKKIIIHFETSLWHLFYSVEHDHLVFRARPGVQNTSYREKKAGIPDNSRTLSGAEKVSLRHVTSLNKAAKFLHQAEDILSEKKKHRVVKYDSLYDSGPQESLTSDGVYPHLPYDPNITRVHTFSAFKARLHKENNGKHVSIGDQPSDYTWIVNYAADMGGYYRVRNEIDYLLTMAHDLPQRSRTTAALRIVNMLVLTRIDRFRLIKHEPKRVRHRIKKIKPLKSNNLEVQLKRTRPMEETPHLSSRARAIKLVSDRIKVIRTKAKPKVVVDDNRTFDTAVNDVDRIIKREVDIKDLRGSIQYWIMLNTLLMKRTNFYNVKKTERAEYRGDPVSQARNVLISFIREILPRCPYYEGKGYLSKNKELRLSLDLPAVYDINPSRNTTIAKMIRPYRVLELMRRDSNMGWVTSENLFRHYGEVE